MNKINSNLFVDKWKTNGEDLVERGIYEWAAEMLEHYTNILEIGCGTGHSTSILVTMDHKVFAIDRFPECVDAAYTYVSETWDCKKTETFEMSNADATFMCADIFCDNVTSQLQSLNIDAVIMWLPGQTDDTIKLVDACVEFAKRQGVPIQILERANNKEEGQEVLNEIAQFHQIKLVRSVFKTAPWNQEGVRLLDLIGDEVWFSLGLFFPD